MKTLSDSSDIMVGLLCGNWFLVVLLRLRTKKNQNVVCNFTMSHQFIQISRNPIVPFGQFYQMKTLNLSFIVPFGCRHQMITFHISFTLRVEVNLLQKEKEAVDFKLAEHCHCWLANHIRSGSMVVNINQWRRERSYCKKDGIRKLIKTNNKRLIKESYLIQKIVLNMDNMNGVVAYTCSAKS